MTAQLRPTPERSAVLAKATLSAAEQLGLNHADLAAVNRPGFCRQSRASYFLSNRSQYEQSTLPRRIQDRGGQTNP